MTLEPVKFAGQSSQHLYHIGLSECGAGHFIESLKQLNQADPLLLKEKRYSEYLQSQVLQIIMHTEMENFSEINNIHSNLMKIVWNHKPTSMDFSRLHYSLGFSCLRQQELNKAQKHFDSSSAQALKMKETAADDLTRLTVQMDLCYTFNGFACLYFARGQLKEAGQEIQRGQQAVLQFQKLSDTLKVDSFNKELASLDFSFYLLKAHILHAEQQYESAEDLYWLCYEKSQKTYRKKYMAPHLFYSLGKNYMSKKNYDQASHFLNLAKKSIDPKVLKLLNRNVDQALSVLKNQMTDNYDIIVNFETKLLVEKQKGHVNFKNQFVVLDMLKLFLFNPGRVYSKEDLVEKIWKQKYDPVLHDNKIYVTVKRLRELVEPNHSTPKYIFRTKQGYYINSHVKVLIK